MYAYTYEPLQTVPRLFLRCPQLPQHNLKEERMALFTYIHIYIFTHT